MNPICLVILSIMERLGASILDREKGMVEFGVYAAGRPEVWLLLKAGGTVEEIPMKPAGKDVFRAVVEGRGLDLRYKFLLKGEEGGAFPDPYSHYQPEGVHGFSQVVDHEAYRWEDAEWRGIEWEKAVIYELHPGTFSERGTFDGIVEKLDYLLELGVNTVELMPLSQTPGRWNWGYDGVNLFSVNHNYGRPEELKYLVNCCHRRGLAVILDIVFNHFGPEGSYLGKFGPYFTDKYKTPWGAAVNFDDEGCAAARRMVLDSVRHWIERYHFDGLRLDAVHAIFDCSRPHILEEIAATARELEKKLGRRIVIIAETDANDVRLIKPPGEGGYGIDAQWMDDFHHAVHTALTGEDKGYYQDYGRIEDLEKVYKNYLYTGEYSRFWKKRRGSDAAAASGSRFVVAIQTHDQVGNRAWGERLSQLVEFPYLKAAAGLLFMAPYIPMLFMGEEYAEENPFLFFTDYQDPALKKAVAEGRREEFASFGWQDIPNPQDESTFFRSKLTPRHKWRRHQEQMFCYYRDLIALRREHPVLMVPDKEGTEVKVDPELRLVRISRRAADCILTALANLGRETISAAQPPGKEIFNSEEARYGGREKAEVGGGGAAKSSGKAAAKAGELTLLPGQFVIFESPLV
ncbi:MAG TPA: malto-oligosyltrehalose trehalohydrolase [Bacillota bacterium]|nr:malto-oligosyltrehalose trehalohydrolase [Bacillota bacterium]